VTCSDQITVPQDDSLHLRPMQVLVENASAFECKIVVGRGGKLVDAKSIFDVMMLATQKGPLTVEAEGNDADEAVRTIVRLLNNELNRG